MENTQQQLKQEDSLNQNPTSANPLSNQKGNFLLIIGIIVLLLVVGAGGYFLYQKQVNKPVTVPQTSQLTPSPTPDETANWKTYTNIRYGYSVKYPPKLTSIERSLDKGDVVVSIVGKSEGSTDEGYYTGLFSISSFTPGDLLYDSDEIAKELLNLKVDDQYKPSDRMVGTITRTYPTYKRLPDITIDGLQAKVFENSKTLLGGVEKRFYINKGKYTYLITSEFLSSQTQYFPQELYDQILATFKFIQ